MSGIEKLQAAVIKDCDGGEGCFNPNGCDKVKYRYEPQDNPRLAEMGMHTKCIRNIKCFHAYCDTYKWVIERAEHYAQAIGTTKEAIIDQWESERSYWYMNFYQECNQSKIKAGTVKLFDTLEDFTQSVDRSKGFRCPACNGVSTDPSKCTCEKCDWKAYGLLGTLGKGITVMLKSTLQSQHIFMPVSWEEAS